ncbi:helix-turn-helix domain-containing protein [Ramlibacter sp. G-1-2-2]|uniref:Helix-turn-helix domain-containing protein n=1 Tax=Ramlibacter agri TaxID=2728837 RepID=A0A848HCC2_9BURK|nr:helix-turn-helix domain-containing protein [Ramlibacter agri]NML48097.1 helix-turn-helix domain-containing protein [Ramlibacter agri]
MSEAPLEPGQQPQGPTAGQLLREAREAAGLHVATLAANLKVPVRKLEALEEDQYDQIGDSVFVRALASSVARTLKIDPQPVLERLPQTAKPRLAADRDGINAPFSARGDAPRSGWLDQVSRPVALTVVALLLAAVVLIFLPVAQRHEDASQAAKNNEPAMPPGTPVVINPPSENPPAVAASAPLTPSPALAPVPAAPAPVAAAPANATPMPLRPASAVAAAPARSASVPAAAASAPVAKAAVPAAPAASGPAASGAPIAAKGIVTFRAKGSSWVQVTDAHGTPVLRKLLEAGETAGASGALPLSVTVGSVEQTEVEVRGKPYNLQPVSHDNVARFQVN